MKADFIPGAASWAAAAAATRRDPSAAHVYSPRATLRRALPPALAPSPRFAFPPPLHSGEKGRISAAGLKAIVKVSAPGRSPWSSPRWSGGGIGEQFSFPAMPRQGTGMQKERSSPVEPVAGASSPWSWMEGTQHGRGDGPARLETSTWPAARAGSGDAALAPPLRRCPRCPNRPTRPSRVPHRRFLSTARSPSHPARCEGAAPVPRAGRRGVPPVAQRQGWQMPAGMARPLCGTGMLAEPLGAQYSTRDTFFPPKCSLFTWKITCVTAVTEPGAFPHSTGRRTNCFLAG